MKKTIKINVLTIHGSIRSYFGKKNTKVETSDFTQECLNATKMSKRMLHAPESLNTLKKEDKI